ncbi:uncharacterized protein LOC136038514 isoform X2 [Artemia franciscana]|uniref:uncharacterized protein LOC136038514 isoform X2 n=1 Tax=Artemia franciscana TaxID=6661 RepID=UPI0032DBBC74
MSISSDYEYRRDNHPSQSREGQKLFVKKIPMDMEEDEICDIFGRYGTLTRASILPTKPEFDYKAAIVIFDSPQEAELALNSISGAPPHNLHVSFAKSHREPRTDSSNISNLRYGNRPGRTTQEIPEVTSPKNNSNQPPNRQSFQNMPLPTKGNPACHFYPCPNDALFKCSACGADYCREFCRNLDWKRHQEEDCMPKPPLVPRTALITDRGERSVRKEMSAQQQSVNGESNNLLRNEESLRLPRAPFSQKNLQQLNEHRLTNGDATPSSPCRDVNIRARSKSRTRADYPTSDSRVDIKGKGESGTHPRETVNGLRGRGGFHRQDARNGIMSNNAENATNNFPQGNLDEKPVSSQTEKKEVESKMRLEEQALKRADNSKGSNDSPRNTVRVSTPLIRKTEVVPSTCPVKQEDQIKTIPPCDFTLSPRTEVEVLFVRNPNFITNFHN